jgi:PTH1 family peptidyl-tRNA hydrolase
MRVVFGLGNPGPEYAGNRHNVGFMAVDRLSEAFGCRVSNFRFQSLTGKAIIGPEIVLLAQPQTFMNSCGPSLRRILEDVEGSPASTLVIADDFHLPLGMVRIRARGSSGGHNGLKSIQEALGTTEYPRLRIGIGDPGRQDPYDFVLQDLSVAERKPIEDALGLVVQAVETWTRHGIDEAMNRFNRKDTTQANERDRDEKTV